MRSLGQGVLGAEPRFGRRQNQDGGADNAPRLLLSTHFFY